MHQNKPENGSSHPGGPKTYLEDGILGLVLVRASPTICCSHLIGPFGKGFNPTRSLGETMTMGQLSTHQSWDDPPSTGYLGIFLWVYPPNPGFQSPPGCFIWIYPLKLSTWFQLAKHCASAWLKKSASKWPKKIGVDHPLVVFGSIICFTYLRDVFNLLIQYQGWFNPFTKYHGHPGTVW